MPVSPQPKSCDPDMEDEMQRWSMKANGNHEAPDIDALNIGWLKAATDNR